MPREVPVKHMSTGSTRRIRLRGVVAYPAITVALVASVALVLTPFGPAQGMALAALPTPTETSAPTTAAPTTAAPTTAAPTTAVPTSAVPTSAVPTSAVPTLTPSPVPGPIPSLTAAPGDVPVDHHVLARIEGYDFQTSYLPVDAPVLDASKFQTFRVRFQMHNAGTDPITSTPQLEYRPDGASGFALVPENPQLGVPFYVGREWVPSLGPGGGTNQGPLGEVIAVGDLKMPSQVGQAAVGHHSMGANPDAPITLPAASYTEQEFTVRLTIDTHYLTGYELRITDGVTALAGTQVARIVLGPPPLELSAGQRQGLRVGGPTTKSAGVAYPLLSAPTIAAGTSAAAVPAGDPANTPRYALAAGSVAPTTVVAVTSAAAGSTDSHNIASAQCSACHRGHAALGPNLLVKASQSAVCFACHDGMGATANVKAQYALTRPVNNPAAREYYSHDAVTPAASTKHTQSQLDEFGGLSNRHSECADCHNSHRAGVADSTQTTTGWDVPIPSPSATPPPGRLTGVSGVSVVNGAAGSAPTYTFLNGVTDVVTREYQLCFKCHSGSTTLTSNAGLKPSQYALDKGVELNPNNPSFHPVEAAGTNQTTKMAASLAGPSPYKLWNFTTASTVRCVNCHASSATPGVTPPLPPLPLPGSSLAPHTSSNRGILLSNYRDRVLASTNAAYNDGDFALCYTCHSNTPFATDGGGTDRTNFFLHGYHTAKLSGMGSSNTDIDTPGAGGGNAICAECHFRLHSTTNKVGAQAVSGSRLVNFAPNVQPYNGVISWTPGTVGRGSCTLTCHGVPHSPRSY